MIDTHAHVHDKAFDDDREAMLERARSHGITQIISVGCDLSDSVRALECALRYHLFASAGIHPHEAKTAPPMLEAALAPLLDDAHTVAVGECGLDYYYDHSPREVQQRVLREHIALAKARTLPLIFHQRDAFEDFTAILREELGGARGVVHCFTGDTHQARVLIEEFGLLLGIGGVLTFKNAQPLRDAVRTVGATHCILETDAPYLAPVPHRGTRNEPAFVAHTAAYFAQLCALSREEVVSVTSRNAAALFGLNRRMDARASSFPRNTASGSA